MGVFEYEIRKNLDLRKIVRVTNIFLKSRFACTTFLSILLSKLIIELLMKSILHCLKTKKKYLKMYTYWFLFPL